jgi:hypothetical protein
MPVSFPSNGTSAQKVSCTSPCETLRSTYEAFLRSTYVVGFAFSVIGVFLIVCALEAVRRTARDYDRWVVTQRKIKFNNNTAMN